MPELYCHYCCRRMPVTHDGTHFTCDFCHHPVLPPAPGHEDDCPRSRDGRHLAYRQAAGDWQCAQCNSPVPMPPDADRVRV